MPKHHLYIAPAARDDLKDIYRFGLGRWGQAQSDAYLATLNELFWTLLEQPLMGLERLELFPDIRSLSIQSHSVFYRVTSERVEIIRVLHGRQDPHFHLK